MYIADLWIYARKRFRQSNTLHIIYLYKILSIVFIIYIQLQVDLANVTICHSIQFTHCFLINISRKKCFLNVSSLVKYICIKHKSLYSLQRIYIIFTMSSADLCIRHIFHSVIQVVAISYNPSYALFSYKIQLYLKSISSRKIHFSYQRILHMLSCHHSIIRTLKQNSILVPFMQLREPIIFIILHVC